METHLQQDEGTVWVHPVESPGEALALAAAVPAEWRGSPQNVP